MEIAMSSDRLLTASGSPVRRPQPSGGQSTEMNGYLALARWDFQAATMNKAKFIRSYTATWRVPLAPSTESDQTVYLFMGMETADSKSILQPVLQWGKEVGGGGGTVWSVACYFVDGRSENLKMGTRTKSVRVSSGDVLDATIELVSREKDLFGYSCGFKGINGCGIYVESPLQFVQTGIALEVASVGKSSDLPMSKVTHFEDLEILLDDGTRADPSWQIRNCAIEYGVRAIPIAHDGVQSEIDIYYRA
jgi:hypothetical protein